MKRFIAGINDPILNDKIILITGATSGIGRATARSLARDGCKIIFTARDENKAFALQDEIIRESGNEDIHFITGDLSVCEEVKSIAEEYKRKYDRLDILINNAGGYFHTRKLTADGYEYTFALNHLAYFGLTLQLFDLMKKSTPSRIINVASEASRTGHINFDDLMAEKKFSGIKAYCQSKLANLLFTYELNRRIRSTGVTVNAMHPGTVRTNFGNEATGIYRFFFNLFVPFMRKPEKGAETVVFLARSPEAGRYSGKYFHDKKQIKSSRESYDQVVSNRLWQKSLELTGLDAFDVR